MTKQQKDQLGTSMIIACILGAVASLILQAHLIEWLPQEALSTSLFIPTMGLLGFLLVASITTWAIYRTLSRVRS